MSKGVQKVVSWFLPKKSLIKFEDSDDSLSLSSKVIEVANFEKYPILKGDVVDVSIENDEVVFLRKVSGAKKASSESPKTEEKKESSSKEVKKLTVVGVWQNESIKFNEKINNKQWVKLSDSLKTQNLESIGFVANNEVEVTLENNIITDVKIVGNVKKDEKQSTNSVKSDSSVKKSSSYRDEDSMDRRSASMTAKDIIVAFISVKSPIVDEVAKVEVLIERLTQKIYAINQRLQ